MSQKIEIGTKVTILNYGWRGEIVEKRFGMYGVREQGGKVIYFTVASNLEVSNA